MGLSPATLLLSSVPLLATSPAAIVTRTRNSGDSGLRGLVAPGNSVTVAQKAGKGWTKRAERRCPSFSGLLGG